jgi:hypothetical protein
MCAGTLGALFETMADECEGDCIATNTMQRDDVDATRQAPDDKRCRRRWVAQEDGGGSVTEGDTTTSQGKGRTTRQ